MFVIRIAFLPVRLGAMVTKGTTKATYRTVCLVGVKRLLLVGVGVGIGLLVAPGPGRELRDKVKAALGGATPTGVGGSTPASTGAAAAPSAPDGPERRLQVAGTNGHA